jgi:hypothetical protein
MIGEKSSDQSSRSEVFVWLDKLLRDHSATVSLDFFSLRRMMHQQEPILTSPVAVIGGPKASWGAGAPLSVFML